MLSSILFNTFQFQFQYGAIISRLRSPITDPASVFQFQYGAIIRSIKDALTAYIDKFQFQYGAIISYDNGICLK